MDQDAPLTMKRRHPPSSFFPFQAYAGNPDPIPSRTLSRVSSSNSLYKPPPRSSSVQSFRAPFLSPSSRPSSSLWSPPSYPLLYNPTIKPKPPLPSTALTHPLQPDDKPWLKHTQPRTHSSYFITLSFIILGVLAAAFIALIGYITVPLPNEKNLCLVLDDQFSTSSLDESVWNYDVQLANSNFGSDDKPGQSGFHIVSKSPDNIYLSNNNLYIVPTLSSDLSSSNSSFSLQDCTSTQSTQCTTTGTIPPIISARIHTKSKRNLRFGRIAIRAKLPIGDWLHPHFYLLPESPSYGDYPASGQISLLQARGNGLSYPSQGANYLQSSLLYGPFQSLQNKISGVFSNKRSLWSQSFHQFIFEWDDRYLRAYVDKRTQSLLEIPIGKLTWNPFQSHRSPSSFYFSQNQNLNRHPSFWDKAEFPSMVREDQLPLNYSTYYPPGTEVPLVNVYGNASDAAPFDQSFYLVVELGVGGTMGWFPDGLGRKPWFDGLGPEVAMKDFQKDQETWLKTWGKVGGKEERALRIDYIKMWEKC